jgi:hypothetical protein
MKASKRQVQIQSELDPTISENEGRHAVRSLGPTVQRMVGMAGREAAGQDAARRAAAGRLPRLVLPGHRSVFVRESDWQSGTGLRLPGGETDALMRLLRSRDLCILLTLAQHHYLTTDLLRALFFPSIRSAQLRLRWLTRNRRLLMRWRQLEPRDQGWRRRHSLFMLAERGAVVLARATKQQVRPIVKRSWHAAEYALQLAHDLDVNAFFVALAAASRELPDQGLYHWVGQDSLRREYQDEGTELAPDGWGRYLTPAGEVLFSLEWDLGTESSKRLTEKARSYVRYFSARPGGDLNHVLFVGTGPVRERTIRSAISRARASNRSIPFASTHMGLLQEQGPLGTLWLSLDGSERMRLAELDSVPRTGRPVADCVGKAGWWERRPGAGEGA